MHLQQPFNLKAVTTMNVDKRKTQVEVLAPAGSLDIMKAVVAAGADAIYLGGNMFGARAFANNFNDEELICAIEYAHLFGRKVYLTVNTLLKSREIENSLIEYLIPFYEAGLDAVIVQDMGVFNLIRKHFPDMDIHASTQMTQTGVYGSRLLKELGASRIVTSHPPAPCRALRSGSLGGSFSPARWWLGKSTARFGRAPRQAAGRPGTLAGGKGSRLLRPVSVAHCSPRNGSSHFPLSHLLPVPSGLFSQHYEKGTLF